MTQAELLATARERRPGLRFAASKDGDAVGAWVEEWGRFVVIASRVIGGEWVSLTFEVFINGRPPYGPDDWQE